MRVIISASNGTSQGLYSQDLVDRLRESLAKLLPCNCGHLSFDHELKERASATDDTIFEVRHCNGYGTGTCACDYFTEMENLEYVKWVSDQRNLIK